MNETPPPPAATRPSLARRLLRILAFLLLFAAVAAPIALHFAKPRIRSLIVEQLQDRLGVAVSLGELDLSITGNATLHDLRIAQPAGFGDAATPLLSVRSASASLNPFSLLAGPIRVGSVEVDAPEARIILAESGELNLGAIFRKLSEGKGEGGGTPLAVRVDRISVRDGTVRFQDAQVRRPPYELPIRSLVVTIENLHVNDPVEGQPTRIDLSAELATPDGVAPLKLNATCGTLGGLIDATVGAELRKFDTRVIEPYTTSAATVLLGGTGMEAELRATIVRSEITDGEATVISLADGQRYSARFTGPLAHPRIDKSSVLLNAFRLPFARLMNAGRWLVGQGGPGFESFKAVTKEVGKAVGETLKGVGDALNGLFGGSGKKKPDDKPRSRGDGESR